MHHPTDRIAHTTAFVTPVVEHWLEREIAQYRKNDVVLYHAHIQNIHLTHSYILRKNPTPQCIPRVLHILMECNHFGGGGGGGGKKERFYLTNHSTHFIYGYMVSDTW